MQAQLHFPKRNDNWIGKSHAIEDVRRRVEGIVSTHLPVLIAGETGTGKSIAARILHLQNHKNGAPFVSECCRRWQGLDIVELMDECWQHARGGTLFLRNIEMLSSQQAFSIKDFWLNSEQNDSAVRLIASYNLDSQSFDNKAQHNDFIAWLQYHCLSITLPSLRERIDDLPDLIAWYQSRNPELANMRFQTDAMEVLKQYAWPDNVKQLKRCLDKLAILVRGNEINRGALLENFPGMQEKANPVLPFPFANGNGQQLLSQQRALEDNRELTFTQAYMGSKSTSLSVQAEKTSGAVTEPGHSATAQDIKVESKFNQDILGLHPALDKAIDYIQSNYQAPLTMDNLSTHACVSPSHLSFLFKRYLGMPFKQVLLRLRIEQAMYILRTRPQTHVTQVCDDVGFCDLSFFVRKFKATVGVSPGAYRDQFDKRKQYFL